MLFSGVLMLTLLSSCVDIEKSSIKPIPLASTITAVLGPISGGEVTIYRFKNNQILGEGNTAKFADDMLDNTNLKADALVGISNIDLLIPRDMSDTELVKIIISQGYDIDYDDDTLIDDAQFKKLNGVISAITRLSSLKSNDTSVNVLSTFAVQMLGTHSINVEQKLSLIAKKLLNQAGDINQDGLIDFQDLARFNPKLRNSDNTKMLQHNMVNQALYQKLLPNNNASPTFIEALFSDDKSMQNQIVTSYFPVNMMADKPPDYLAQLIAKINSKTTISSADLNAIVGISSAIPDNNSAYSWGFYHSTYSLSSQKTNSENIKSTQAIITQINHRKQHSPVINASASIEISQASKTIYTLIATDADSLDVIYFSNNHASFTLNNKTGVLSTAHTLAVGDYQLRLFATDGAGNQVSQTLNIKILEIKIITPPLTGLAKIIEHNKNNNQILTITDYNTVGLSVLSSELSDLNQLVTQSASNLVSTQSKLALLLNKVRLPILTITASKTTAGGDLIWLLNLSNSPTLPAIFCQTNTQGSAIIDVDFIANNQNLTDFSANKQDFIVNTRINNNNQKTVVIVCNQAMNLRFANINASQLTSTGTILGKTTKPKTIPNNLQLKPQVTQTFLSVLNTNYNLNIASILSTTPLLIKIPIIATSTSILGAYQTSTILTNANLSAQAETNIVLNLAWASQTLSQKTAIIASLTMDDSNAIGVGANDGYYQIKQLNIDNQPNGILLASLSYPYNASQTLGVLSLQIIPAIADRNFGDGSHDFLYLPITNPNTDRVWLNNNLGADYSNKNHANFNPNQQAIMSNDNHAQGSLFQWGRSADGHELINKDNNKAIYGATSTKSNHPKHPEFIKSSAKPYDWRINPDDELWQFEQKNIVCPIGYNIPSHQEWLDEVASWQTTYTQAAFDSVLKLPSTGYRAQGDAKLKNTTDKGYYWSKTVSGDNVKNRYFSNTSGKSYSRGRANGYGVRCINTTFKK